MYKFKKISQKPLNQQRIHLANKFHQKKFVKGQIGEQDGIFDGDANYLCRIC